MSELVDTCVAIATAREDEVTCPYTDTRLLKLGSLLLSKSGLGREFHLTPAKRSNHDVAICFGGGIDSYCATVHAIKQGLNPILVYVDYGQPYAEQEKNVLLEVVCSSSGREAFQRDLGKDLTCVISEHVLVDKKDKDWAWQDYIIPARNLVLAAVGSNYADEVWIVATARKNSEIGTPDKTPKFFKETSAVFSSYYGRSIKVTTPYASCSKADVVADYLAKGGSVQALLNTFSCYTPPNNKVVPTHCGTCYACYKRWRLFTVLSIEADSHFVFPPRSGINFAAYEEQEGLKRGEI